ncbi:MAG: BatA and WFA domain-containing protein [Pirellulaceae bacterium]|nr:BatA and WFA domain-containing protein [Pirellulaceae bacterium]
MSALHVWLMALGVGLAVGPIVLHLLLQEKPKRLPFPALRFVIAKQQHARRSFRLRHWVLMSLRVAMIALAALALSRPAAATALFGSSLLLGGTILSGALFLFLTLYWRNKVRSQPSSLRGETTAAVRSRSQLGATWPLALLALVVLGHVGTAVWLAYQIWQSDSGPVLTGKQPVAAALIIDTSPRMLYRKENQTRLERAQQLADAVIELLPAGSQLTIVDTSPDPVGLSLDLAAARQQVGALRISYQPQPIPNRIRAALQLLDDSPLDGRELFVITDLSRPGWTAAPGTPNQLNVDPEVSLYVIDVGAKSHENWSVEQWDLPTPAITPGGLIQVRGTIARKAIIDREEDLVREVATDRARLKVAEPQPAEDTAPATTAPEGLLENGAAGNATRAIDLPAEGRTIRMLFEKPETGRPVYRNGETLLPTQHWERLTQVNLAPGQSTEVAFSLPDLPEGIHHGWIEIDGGDALGFDNRRFFTVTVQPAWKALIVNGPGVSDANFLEAIAPESVREKGQAVFDCKSIRAEQLREFNLTDYRVVFFLNPGPLSDEHWQQLYRYVSGGGSVGFFLGHNSLTTDANRSVPHPSFNQVSAQRLLPGQLEAPWRQPEGLIFEPTAWDHPVFSRMQPLRTVLMWSRLEVFMHLGLKLVRDKDKSAEPPPSIPNATEDLPPAKAADQTKDPAVPNSRDDTKSGAGDAVAKDADNQNEDPLPKAVRILATFSNNMPALVEATVGQGQVLLMTTPVTDPTRPDDGRRPWNSFAISDDRSFTYWLLATEIARHLATAKSANLNGLVGDSFVLPNDQANAPSKYFLYRPENQEPVDVAVERGRLYLDFNDRPGAYRLRGLNNQQEVHLRGFTVNVPSGQSDLSRIGKPQLDSWLGRGRYAVAENESQIQRIQGAGRVGLEFYPSLIRLLAVAFLAEILFSNWFYREPPRKKTAQEIIVGRTE